MKKTLIALTLAALPVAAMADVTIYGNIRAGFYNHSTKQGDAGRKSINTVDDFGSYVGFKGSEDVAGGLKAIWQVETGIFADQADPKGSAWASRDTFIGLEGGFGKVRAGYVRSQFGENMGDVDAWEYTNNTADGYTTANGLGIFTRTDVRMANAVRYDSPTWAGFDFNVTHGLDEMRRDAKREGNAYVTVLGLNYQNSGYFAKYGFGYYNDSYRNDSGDLKAGQAHRLELGYNANNLLAVLAYQYTKGFADRNQVATGIKVDDSDNLKASELGFTVGYTFGAITPKVTYMHGFKAKNVNGGDKLDNSKYDQVILGADYALSKRTTAMFNVGYLNQGTGALGAVTDPNAGVSTSDKPKIKTYSIGVGMRHLF
ncbi:porin [Neisseria sp. Ec49-e6-T10]|uniref:porin n=1 Tax=Neisseria sp. Ec49-e6-T10 TaxID=3140744 RepID=UPI003EBD7E35